MRHGPGALTWTSRANPFALSTCSRSRRAPSVCHLRQQPTVWAARVEEDASGGHMCTTNRTCRTLMEVNENDPSSISIKADENDPSLPHPLFEHSPPKVSRHDPSRPFSLVTHHP
eukprot:c38408_g1_i1 orf=1-342(-)